MLMLIMHVVVISLETPFIKENNLYQIVHVSHVKSPVMNIVHVTKW